MIVTVTFVFILTVVIIDKGSGKERAEHRKTAVKKGVKGRTGTYDIKLFDVPSPYEDRCFRIEFYQKGRLVHKDIDYLSEDAAYTEVIKHFVKKMDEKFEKEINTEASGRFDVESWDGEVYEENAVEFPKKD